MRDRALGTRLALIEQSVDEKLAAGFDDAALENGHRHAISMRRNVYKNR